MSNGYRPGVREVRPGEMPPTGWDCAACGIGKPCFSANPMRLPECGAVHELGYAEGVGYVCSLPAGHEGEHEAWALPEGGTFDACSEHLAAW